MERLDQLRFETKVMDILWSEYNEYGDNFRADTMESFVDYLHQCVENAARDFAEDLEIDYTPVF